MDSCQHQRDQADAQLSELQKQTFSLPHVFPWPGLGERRQAVEQVQTLLDQTTALAPVLSNVRTQVSNSKQLLSGYSLNEYITNINLWCFVKTAELFEITQDENWSDPSWAAKEDSIPALLKELTVSLTL